MRTNDFEGISKTNEKEVKYIENSTPNQNRLKIGEDWEVYTPREVMKIIFASRNTVYNILKSGKLKYFKVGTQYRIYRKDLENYIHETANFYD